MIPMIDLLMVTISFLLITAVWTHMSRLDATAQVPGPPGPPPPNGAETALHIDMRSPEKFTLVWKQGSAVVRSVEVAEKPVTRVDGAVRTVRYPELASKIEEEWKTNGSHRGAGDAERDHAVLHTGAETPYASLVGVMDAVYETRKPVGPASSKLGSVPAFHATFSVD